MKKTGYKAFIIFQISRMAGPGIDLSDVYLILNKTKHILEERDEKTENSSFGFFVEGIILVRRQKPLFGWQPFCNT